MNPLHAEIKAKVNDMIGGDETTNNNTFMIAIHECGKVMDQSQGVSEVLEALRKLNISEKKTLPTHKFGATEFATQLSNKGSSTRIRNNSPYPMQLGKFIQSRPLQEDSIMAITQDDITTNTVQKYSENEGKLVHRS